ncbi:MAG: bifunctional DNA-formamidopyrimidine glycosylase/DNA-(apurinic or apyrimidinic site) lyase [Mailhella sp.]|nr:bifunctional DNA-formamidopyrimidine glycosylase/DNA-(apurinic or apyrimidinic site) lyase [Mailhella sp.]
MPELPEVETIARTLAPDICGRRITAIRVLEKRSWQGHATPDDIARMQPLICAVSRRGKLLLLHFGEACRPCSSKELAVPDSADAWPLRYAGSVIECGRPEAEPENAHQLTGIAFHLRMTGGLFPQAGETAVQKHTRIIFELSDGTRLFFNDARKFGSARALSGQELKGWPFWQELGPEPLEISDETFAARFKCKRQVKSLLLDQKIIAGVGNIYAAESLFAAGIRPDSRGNELSDERLKKLHRCLVEILLRAIRECGSTISDYRSAHGDAGSFQNSFRVYGREGQKCLACGSELCSARIGGRSTVWCPRCQKA